MLTALPQKLEHGGNATLLLRILATDAAQSSLLSAKVSRSLPWTLSQ